MLACELLGCVHSFAHDDWYWRMTAILTPAFNGVKHNIWALFNRLVPPLPDFSSASLNLQPNPDIRFLHHS